MSEFVIHQGADDQTSSRNEIEVLSPVIEEKTQHRGCWEEFKHEIVQLRWRALILICLMCLGQYYISDFPGSIGTGPVNTIQSRFFDHGKKYNQAMDQALYSVYSYPNMFLAILGGLLIDKYLGICKATMLFISCILVGSILFALGVYVVNYPVIVISRFIYGLGGESNTVASSAFAVRYFGDSKWLALAFGISITFCRFGTSFTFMFSPMIADAWNVSGSCFVGVITCVISFVSVVILCLIDVRAIKRGIIVERPASERMNFRDILSFRAEVWLLTGICVFGYCAIFPFAGIARNFFEVKYGISGETASKYISLYTYTSAALGPIIGASADRIGRHPFWMLTGCIGFLVIHLLAIFAYAPPALLMIVFGFSLTCLAAGLWPAVPYVVDKHMVGFCYGVITALQNIGLASWPIVAGVILDKNTPAAPPQPVVNGTTAEPSNEVILPTLHGYQIMESFLVATTIAVIIAIIALIIVDRAHGSILISKPSVRVAKMHARDEQQREKLADSLVSVA